MTTPPRHAFPNPRWSWPHSGRQALLRAALLPDPAQALQAFEGWLEAYDIEAIGFADHRLLAAISERHGRSLSALPAYPRVQGLQRQIWTQSRLRVHHVLPTLEKMAAAGIEIMLLKGAARIALNPQAQRQRAHQDVDILVPDAQMQAAARILAAEGWQTVRGDTALAAMARAPATRAINFQKHPWGDIDLHRRAYHGRNHHKDLDAALWARARHACYFGIPVLVPEPAERLAMILSHGAWSPEAHSDWLIDAAEILTSDAVDWDPVDWDYFAHVLAKRRIGAQVKIGLSFLHEAIGLALPATAQPLLAGGCDLATLLIARDAATLPAWLRPLRQLCYVTGRARRDRGDTASIPPSRLAFARRDKAEAPPAAPGQTEVPLASMTLAPGCYTFSAELTFAAPSQRRRVELELNTAAENLARFRIFALPSPTGRLKAKLSAKLRITQACDQAQLIARPSKLLTAGARQTQLEKYAALPFTLGKVTLERR